MASVSTQSASQPRALFGNAEGGGGLPVLSACFPERERRRSGTGESSVFPGASSAPRRRRPLLWRRTSSAHASRSGSSSLRLDADRDRPAATASADAAVARHSFRSNSNATSLPPRPGSAALRRVREVLFERPNARTAEDLRSTKRRIIQVSRQSERSPALCALGFRSRTGWEPIRAVRENQDCLVALLPWGPSGQYCLFGALDGHGRAGHHASMFVAQRITSFLLRSLKRAKLDPAHALFKAFAYAQQRLDNESEQHNIDCTVSGTTAVFVLLDGAQLYCANVGDSRAVMGRSWLAGKPAFVDNVAIEANGALSTAASYSAIPLSFDHKPSRHDEKLRIERAGGRVDAWQSCDVGAERVWLPDSRTPGLAVTRSFGDQIVKDIGVNAIPEIYSVSLSSHDRFIVIASDGVFEFLSDDEVVATASKYRETGTPQGAAEEIVKLSAERWIEDDSVIDDISCIVVFLDVREPLVSEPCVPKLVEIDPTMSEVNTPLSSRPNSARPSTALFGQYSVRSNHTPLSVPASHGALVERLQRAAAESNPNTNPFPPPNTNIAANDKPSTPVTNTRAAVNDVVRRYAPMLYSGNVDRSKKSVTKSDKEDASISDVFSSNKYLGLGRQPTPPVEKAVSPVPATSSVSMLSPADSTASEGTRDVEMFEANDTESFQGAVSDSSSRFGDADAEAGEDGALNGALRIAPSMSGPDISPSDDEDDEKYADADDLIPIDVHRNVVRRQEVNAYRRRAAAASPRPERRRTPGPLASSAATPDRREITGLAASVASGSAVTQAEIDAARAQDSGFWFLRQRSRRAMGREQEESGGPSGRLRRLLPKRPRSSFSAGEF